MKKLMIKCWRRVRYSKAERRGFWLQEQFAKARAGDKIVVPPGVYAFKDKPMDL